MADRIISRRENGVGHVVFNNPEKRNAVSLEMWQAVEGVLEDFAADDDVRLVVLSGAGDKAFVSGADISKFEDERSSAEAFSDSVRCAISGAKPTMRLACAGGNDQPIVPHRPISAIRAGPKGVPAVP